MPSFKEMRFKFSCAQHDLDIKKRKVQEFLKDGHKVGVAIVMKGREKSFRQEAKEKLFKFVSEIVPNTKISEIKDGVDRYSILLIPGT